MKVINPVRFICFVLHLLSLCLSPGLPVIAETKEHVPFVVSGVVTNSGSAVLINQFVNKLSNESGYVMKPVYVKTYADLSKILRENPKAIGWTCGAPFVEDHIKDGQQIISIPLFNKKPLYSSLIIARKGSSHKTLAEFKDKIFAYSDPRSNSGFVAPSYQLKVQGIDIKKHFRLLLHAGNHERSIKAMVHGLADVAAIDEYIWVNYANNNPEEAGTLQEIERIGPFPFTPIVAGSKVDKKVIVKLQNILSDFDNNSEGIKLLESFGLNGFVIKGPEFYQPIKVMLEKLNWHL